MLLATKLGIAAGVAVVFITALGTLSENLILQEISSLVMYMMLPFVIWLILTPNATGHNERVVDQAAWDETMTTRYKCSNCGATK